jgi:hypothetical protein
VAGIPKEHSVHVHLDDESFQAIKALARAYKKPLKRFLSSRVTDLHDQLKGKEWWSKHELDPKAKNRLIGLSKDAHRHLKRIANNTDQHNWEVMAHLVLELIEVESEVGSGNDT